MLHKTLYPEISSLCWLTITLLWHKTRKWTRIISGVGKGIQYRPPIYRLTQGTSITLHPTFHHHAHRGYSGRQLHQYLWNNSNSHNQNTEVYVHLVIRCKRAIVRRKTPTEEKKPQGTQRGHQRSIPEQNPTIKTKASTRGHNKRSIPGGKTPMKLAGTPNQSIQTDHP